MKNTGGKIYNFKTYRDAVRGFGSVKNYRDFLNRIQKSREEWEAYVSQTTEEARRKEAAKHYQNTTDPSALDYIFDGDFNWKDYQ